MSAPIIRRVVDLDTGEVRHVTTRWETLTESSVSFGIKRRHIVRALVRRGVLHRRYCENAQQGRYLLTDEAVDTGLGWNAVNRKSGRNVPFVILSEKGLDLIDQDLRGELFAKVANHETRIALDALAQFQAQRNRPLDLQQRVYWLADHSPALTATQVAAGLGVGKAVVARYRAKRLAELDRARRSAEKATAARPFLSDPPSETKAANAELNATA